MGSNKAMIDIAKLITTMQIEVIRKVCTELDQEEKMEEMIDKFVDQSISKMKVKKDKNEPKKPKTSYMFFCDEYRGDVRTNNPELKMGGISKVLGEKWKNVTETEMVKYKKKAEEAKEKYEEDMREYKNKQ